MSYLHTPRLSFTGDFISDVSTVNNDPAHYNNKTFKPNFQEFGKGSTNGWWNPEGGAIFNFQDCSVKEYTLKDGTTVNNSTDDLIGQIVAGAEGRATGKMVDLDPQEQGSSELWAVTLRILNPANEVLLEGKIDVTAFRDLQYRQHNKTTVNGQPLGGIWASVMTNVIWGEKAASHPFFKELKETTEENTVSINLNGFGYYYNHAPDGRFSLGRIIGGIGPWFKNDPRTFTPCRKIYGVTVQSGSIYFGNTNFLFEQKKSRLTVDFGSSFPVADSLGNITFNQKLILGVSNQQVDYPVSAKTVSITDADFQKIGPIDYETGDWLMSAGGIVSIDNIPDGIASQLSNSQLLLLAEDESKKGTYIVLARESTEGYLFRADNFVQRLDTEQTNTVNFYAYQWGQPLADTSMTVSLQAPTPITPISKKNPISVIPGNNYPADGITFNDSISTDKNGLASMTLTGNKILDPRGYLDGQIYTLDYSLTGITTDPVTTPMSNDNVFIHLRSYFEIPENPTWDDISETMTQFSNLYPIMSKYLVDLSDPEAMISKTPILLFAFNQNINDPLYMPATRDLSEAKRKTIVKWLQNPIIETKSKPTKPPALASIKAEELMESPAKKGQELSDKQQKLKDAIRAKSGEFVNTSNIETLKFHA
jgi:hypothetical protein